MKPVAKRVGDDVRKSISESLESIADKLVEVLMDRYDRELLPLSAEDDPVSPKSCREEIKEYLRDTIISRSKEVSSGFVIHSGDGPEFGFDAPQVDPDTTECKEIAKFFIQGVTGRYKAIDRALGEELFGPGFHGGRTGNFYLMRSDAYEEGVRTKNWPSIPDWKMSNFPGVPRFFDDLKEHVVEKIKEIIKNVGKI